MMLSDRGLRWLQTEGHLPAGVDIGPCSVDLRLSQSFARLRGRAFQDLETRVSLEEVEGHSYLLRPNEFVLASTEEEIGVPTDMAAQVHGRSSMGRIGLQVQNAGFIDAGFRGQITLELLNQSANPILLQAGVRICQISYIRLTESCEKPYAGKYQGQRGATGSRLHLDK